MKKFLVIFGVIFAICLFIGLMLFGWVTGIYNEFVQKGKLVDTQWSQVETQYQRRFDLIPNLVNSTKGYLLHEQKVFNDIAQARTHYAGAMRGEKVKATGEIESALARLLVIIENYPNLKANETVKALMDELAGTENRVNVSRQRYNEATYDYNFAIARFPNNILAGMFNFKEKLLFESAKGAEIAPIVNLEVK